MTRSIARLLTVVGAAGILLSCDSSPMEPDHPLPVSFLIVAGNNQTGFINTELPLALKVKVVDSKGKAVPGQLVNFRVTVGGGRMYAGASVTDALGSAQDYWTLGPTLGLQIVEVNAVDPSTGAKQQFGVFNATGLDPTNLTISPLTQDFGSVVLGGTSTSRTFTLSNSGTGATGAITVSMGGANAAEFPIGSNLCNGVSLAPGGNCTVSVSFSPASASVRGASLNVTATPGRSLSSTLTGTGVTPAALAISPTTHDFDTATVGSTTVSQTFTVTNAGGTTSGPISISKGGAHPGDFQTITNLCQGATLAPGASCTISLVFAPSDTGARSATLTATAAPGGSASASLTGQTLPAAVLGISPASFDFGSVDVGSSSGGTFTVRNNGGASTGPIAVSLSGTNLGDFQITGNACQTVSLAPGGSCGITVRFAPTTSAGSGTRAAALSATAQPGGTVSALLTGAVNPARMLISPVSQDFGSVSVGDASVSQSFTVTNAAGVTPPVGVGLGGTNPTDFRIVADNCSGATVWSSCTVTVTFVPGTSGTRTASLQVSAMPVGQAVASLSGTGVTPTPAAIGISPSTISFGNVTAEGLGTTTFTVTNSGGTTSGALSMFIGGTDASQFRFGTNHCVGVTLAPLGNCVVEVLFSPATAGTKSAFVEVTASPGGDVRAALTGAGI